MGKIPGKSRSVGDARHQVSLSGLAIRCAALEQADGQIQHKGSKMLIERMYSAGGGGMGPGFGLYRL